MTALRNVGAPGLFPRMIVASRVNFLLLRHYATTPPEWKPLATGVLALLLVGSCFIALGLFVSTLTRNQIVAGTLTFGLLLGIWILGWMDDPSAGPVAKALPYLGLLTHVADRRKGVIDLKDLVFYLSFMALTLLRAD